MNRKQTIIRTSGPASLGPQRYAEQYLEAATEMWNAQRKRLRFEEYVTERGWSEAFATMVRGYLESQGVL